MGQLTSGAGPIPADDAPGAAAEHDPAEDAFNEAERTLQEVGEGRSGRITATTRRGQPPELGAAHPVLIVALGASAGRVLALDKKEQTTVGRGDDCDVCIADALASRAHARLTMVASGYIYEDLASRNGSYINDKRVTEPQYLRSGDRIQIGETLLRFTQVFESEQEALNTVYEAATCDVLTGVLNRRAMGERLDAEIAFAARHHTDLAVLMVDIDHFKQVNDNLGHEIGDTVLRHLGQLLHKAVRTEDLVARWGGDEFLILVRDAGVEAAVLMAERLRKLVEQHPAEIRDRRIPLTVSCGVATTACCGEKLDQATLLRIADERLYRAKANGRNRVEAG